MLIVTQRKTEIVNLDSMETVFAEQEAACFNPGWNIFAIGARGKSVKLGHYENKTRAREILREIFMEYRIPGKQAYEMPET